MAQKQKKKKNTEAYSVSDTIGTYATYFYVAAMLVVFPIFYRENMLQLSTDKKVFFELFTVMYAICLLPGLFVWIADLIKKEKKLEFRKDSIFIGVLLLAVVISTIFSPDRQTSMIGVSYRTVAADIFIYCAIIYFGIRKYGKYTGGVVWSWIIGSVWVYVIGILCACGINYLHMQDGVKSKEVFLTPLGNTNFNATYVCILAPLAVVMYMICKDKTAKIIYGITACMGFVFAIFIKTESSVMALMAMFVILLYFAVENKEWFTRYIDAIGFYVLAFTIICLLLIVFKDHIYPFDGLNAFLLKWQVVLLMCVFYIALRLLLKWKEDEVRSILLTYRKQILRVVLIIGIAALAVLVVLNVFLKEVVAGSALEILLLTKESFSNRGIIWGATLDMLKDSSPRQLLFGHGIGCYKAALQAHGKADIMYELGMTLNDPHNECLQMMMELGIVGVIGYFGLIIHTLVSVIRKWKDNELCIMIAAFIIVFLIQGLVNCYALTTFPLLFILLGFTGGDILNGEIESSRYSLL